MNCEFTKLMSSCQSLLLDIDFHFLDVQMSSLNFLEFMNSKKLIDV